MLYEQNIPLRPDWEKVISAVIDAALTFPEVDSTRIAVSGWSFGGYLAPRAASGDNRFAACIADPGQLSLAKGFRRAFTGVLGASPEEVADLGNISQPLSDKILASLNSSRKLYWTVVQRGYWANCVDNLRDF